MRDSSVVCFRKDSLNVDVDTLIQIDTIRYRLVEQSVDDKNHLCHRLIAIHVTEPLKGDGTFPGRISRVGKVTRVDLL